MRTKKDLIALLWGTACGVGAIVMAWSWLTSYDVDNVTFLEAIIHWFMIGSGGGFAIYCITSIISEFTGKKNNFFEIP